MYVMAQSAPIQLTAHSKYVPVHHCLHAIPTLPFELGNIMIIYDNCGRCRYFSKYIITSWILVQSYHLQIEKIHICHYVNISKT